MYGLKQIPQEGRHLVVKGKSPEASMRSNRHKPGHQEINPIGTKLHWIKYLL